MAEHLQKLFPDYNVDCEYNRVGNGDPKRLDLLRANDPDCPHDCDQCPNNKCVIFPDIIVHHRGTEDNLLVIEAKTAWNRRDLTRDFKKLAALTDSGEYHYRLGIAFSFAESFAETLKTVIEYSCRSEFVRASLPDRVCPNRSHSCRSVSIRVCPCSPSPRGKK